VQIGDGAALAAATGCTVVADFRAADIALGGQGAPLAPMADKMLFPGHDFYLNLGGIANITCNAQGRFVAFDITGANQVLNSLAQELGYGFDENGHLAAAGALDERLLVQLNSLPFLAQPYPKSLSNQWVQENPVKICQNSPAPVQGKLHTVCRHIAVQLKNSISQIIDKEALTNENYRLLATGGGVFNGFLMDCIKAEIGHVEVVIPAPEHVKFKEACLMALLGVMRLEGAPNCISSVTGASRDAVGGAVYSSS
jgi:anhydro-N-acetylmuramic acid kinase